MSERPILFSAPMVRALLEGRKTQTRRLVKMREFKVTDTPGYDFIFRDRRGLWNDYTTDRLLASKWNPYGAPGDRLWVRETWQLFDDSPLGDDASVPPERLGPAAPWKGCQGDRSITWRTAYRADGDLEHPTHGPANWRPSIHMPRWASRITLEVTGVRVERIQDISEEDARAEGFGFQPGDGLARRGFELAWNGLNGKRAPWSSKPWVWVVEFRRVDA